MFSPLGGAQVLHPMQLGGLGIAIRDLIVWISQKASPATPLPKAKWVFGKQKIVLPASAREQLRRKPVFGR
jgi:hypothetical protein